MMPSKKAQGYLAVLIMLSGLASGPTWAKAAPESSSANGYLMMVHATFDPNVYDATAGAVPPATEAVAATPDEGQFVFNVIPHGLNGIATVVARPVLEIKATGGSRVIEVPANGDPFAQAECEIETSAPGAEGPREACLVFRVDASWFEATPLVDLTLHFHDAAGPQAEVNNLPGHLALHAHQGGATVDLASIDADTTGSITPFVVLRSH